MALAQGGQAEALVGLGVLVVADADGGLLHDPHHRRQHLFARQATAGQVVLDLRAQLGQRPAELGHAAIFGAVAVGAPVGMVDVLLASSLVAAGGLDMPPRIGADPDVGPGRRDHQLGDAVFRAGAVDDAAVGVDIGEALAGLAAGKAGIGVVHIDEAGGGRLLGTGQDIGGHHGSRTQSPAGPGTSAERLSRNRVPRIRASEARPRAGPSPCRYWPTAAGRLKQLRPRRVPNPSARESHDESRPHP